MDPVLKRFILGVDIPRALEMIGIAGVFAQGRWTARCPNALLGHDGVDQNPSWTIRDDIHNEAHGVHACWACGYSGNIVSLVRDVLNLKTWEDSLAWLQTHAMRGATFAPLRIEVEMIEPKLQTELQIPEGVHELCTAGHYHREISHPYRMYWLKRDFSLGMAFRWNIGFAATGQCNGRIWIPVHNRNGKLVNWTARAIDDFRDPRYLRASSAIEPDKGVIFGEAYWDDYPKDVICVMEGELNGIRVDSIFDAPIASLGGGSKLSAIHAAKLLSFRRMVVFADGDKTGDKLTNQLRDLGLPMAVMRFSKGHDPASTPISDLIQIGTQCDLEIRQAPSFTPPGSTDSPTTGGSGIWVG